MNSYIEYIQQLLQKYDDNFKQITLKIINNKSDYDSIVIASEMTAYRPRVDNALFARIKSTGKKPYISFRNKYKNWFIQNDIPVNNIKSDNEFFRVMLSDFQFVLDFGNNDFAEIAAKICLDAMSFTQFGCCDKFKECSDLKRCIHNDPLYSTACMYRKNLENNRIFYGKNKNI